MKIKKNRSQSLFELRNGQLDRHSLLRQREERLQEMLWSAHAQKKTPTTVQRCDPQQHPGKQNESHVTGIHEKVKKYCARKYKN